MLIDHVFRFYEESLSHKRTKEEAVVALGKRIIEEIRK
jgi:hypothetical protein